MSLRLIEIVLPEGYRQELVGSLEQQKVLDIWQEEIEEGRLHLKILVSTENSEEVLDLLEKRFSHSEGFRIILLPVEASIPRPEIEEKPKEKTVSVVESQKNVSRFIRISREELYADIEKTVRQSWVYFIMIVYAAIVASIGIFRNNVVFIIGAMVIAPMLGPNLALSFATTLGDIRLAQKAGRAIALGVLAALIPSFLIGIVFNIDIGIPELISRTEVSLGDVVLALAAGSAAAISFTSELFSALIGVMVAVALLPPLVAFGLLAGSGHWELALGAFLLFVVNLICVNLAGVLTFILQGIRPLNWWETKKARKAARNAVLFWAIFLTILIMILILS
jgi:uncharacterized hydrophobic protein (TIGR00341 family)